MITYVELTQLGHKLMKRFLQEEKKKCDAVATDSTVVKLCHGEADYCQSSKFIWTLGAHEKPVCSTEHESQREAFIFKKDSDLGAMQIYQGFNTPLFSNL